MSSANQTLQTRKAEMPIASRLMEVRNFKRVQAPAQRAEGEGATPQAPAATFDLVLSAGAGVRRFDWQNNRYYLEELVVDESAVNLERMLRGVSLLDAHWNWSMRDVLGIIEQPRFEEGLLVGTATMSRRDEVAGIVLDMEDRVARHISVGYSRDAVEMVAPSEESGMWVYRVTGWTVHEGSLVPIPADMDCQVRGADVYAGEHKLRTFPCSITEIRSTPVLEVDPAAGSTAVTTTRKEVPMSDKDKQTQGGGDQATAAVQLEAARLAKEAAAAERSRVNHINEQVRTHGLPDDFAKRHIEAETGIDAFNGEVLTQLAARSASNPTRQAADIVVTRDASMQRQSDILLAVRSRTGQAKPADMTDGARRYAGRSLIEMARTYLEDVGIKTDGMSRAEIARVAMGNDPAFQTRTLHTVSDFSIALASTVNRTLREAYQSAPRTFPSWCRKGTLSDFRAATRVAAAGDLRLEKVNEKGEFKRGKVVDAGETIQLATYGKVVGVTRQAIINDDLDLFSRLPSFYARAAADFESDTVYGVLITNANMADGNPLFSTQHANTGAAAVIGEASLSEMRAKMRGQKDPSGNNQPLNLMARTLIVPAAIETAAQKQLQAVIVATKAADTNVFNGAYQLVVEPRLDANSLTAWYGAADPAAFDTIEYAYLEGEEGLYTEQRVGFDVDGLEIKARMDFAAKAIDWRGLFRNAGA